MRPYRGWSLGSMPPTETPPLFPRQGLVISGQADVSRPTAGPARVRALRAREGALPRHSPDKKFGLAIRPDPKVGCWLKAPDFSSPSRFCPVLGAFLADWSLENAPFYPQKSLCH